MSEFRVFWVSLFLFIFFSVSFFSGFWFLFFVVEKMEEVGYL